MDDQQDCEDSWPLSSSICSDRSTTHQETGGKAASGDGGTGNGDARPRGGGEGEVAAAGEPSGVEASAADVVASDGVRRTARESEEDPGLRGRRGEDFGNAGSGRGGGRRRRGESTKVS
uniref:DUF834 domain-containing protein n=1 Tax=Oryza brachyantha TaxID=4533 RepID=J3NFD0_ORYBR